MCCFMTPILGLTVKISRFSYDPSFKMYSTQIIFGQNTVMIPHKTYIAHNSAFIYLVGFHRRNILESSGFHGIIFHQALYFCITTISHVYTNLDCHRMFFFVHFKYICKFAIKILQSDTLQLYFNTCYQF